MKFLFRSAFNNSKFTRKEADTHISQAKNKTTPRPKISAVRNRCRLKLLLIMPTLLTTRHISLQKVTSDKHQRQNKQSKTKQNKIKQKQLTYPVPLHILSFYANVSFWSSFFIFVQYIIFKHFFLP